MHHIKYKEMPFLELKSRKNDENTMSFSGYGAVFGNLDAYDDVIEPGAFSNSISNIKASGRMPLMLEQHGGFSVSAQDLTPIGVWTEIKEDPHGLYVEGQLANTARGKDIYELLKMKALSGLSIGYYINDSYTDTINSKSVRHLTDIDLVEISVVSFPANKEARIEAVKTELTIRDAEMALRDAGFSRNQAKAILSKGYSALSLRDAEDNADNEVVALLQRNIALLSKQSRG